jgi:hypothetical protein
MNSEILLPANYVGMDLKHCNRRKRYRRRRCKWDCKIEEGKTEKKIFRSYSFTFQKSEP